MIQVDLHQAGRLCAPSIIARGLNRVADLRRPRVNARTPETPGRDDAGPLGRQGATMSHPLARPQGAASASCGTGRDGSGGAGCRSRHRLGVRRDGRAAGPRLRRRPVRQVRSRQRRGAGRHQLPERRGRALRHRRSVEPRQPAGRLAAGPLEQRRLAWPRRRRQQGRWQDLEGDRPARCHALRRRPLQPLVRPVGRLLGERHRLLHAPVHPGAGRTATRRRTGWRSPGRPTAA